MKPGHVIAAVFVSAFCAGCVSRVTTRDPSLGEISSGKVNRTTGKITETKTFWFWQDKDKKF